MADLSRSRTSSVTSVKTPPHQSLAPVLEQQPSPLRHRDYFVLDDDSPFAHGRPGLQRKLPFQYRGDVFTQHGDYTDGGLYMSRLPPSRKEKQPLSARVGANYKLRQVKLAPVTPTKTASQQQSERESGVLMPVKTIDPSPNKPGKTRSNRKRQYALAVEAMAANRSLHASLLSDNVVPSVMALCRSKDMATLSACVATLGYLSCEPEGRAILLSHSILPLLAALTISPAPNHENLLLSNCVGTLANLTIEDGSESNFVKEKALDCLVKQRRSSALAERACSFAIFNLSCPQYAYPRVDDTVHALAEHGKDARDYETISRAVYNLACVRMNHMKLVEPEAVSMLRLLISCHQCEAARLNALGVLWNLVESGASRRALVRTGDSIRTVVEELPRLGMTANEGYVVCALASLTHLTRETNARELMGSAGALDALAALGMTITRRPCILLRIYRLLAILLSAPENIQAVGERVVEFLLSFRHGHTANGSPAMSAAMSRYVLFALASISSWNDSEERLSMTNVAQAKYAKVSSSGSMLLELDEILDKPQLLERIYQHVEYSDFPIDSFQVRLQMVLLYNLSFRYPKKDVARLGLGRLSEVGSQSKDRNILTLLGGSFFSLCQEYEVHQLLLAAAYAATNEGSFLLLRLARDGDTEAQTMCLNAVCILFDGRSLSRDELLTFIDRIFPVVVKICTRSDAMSATDEVGHRSDHRSDRAALQAACAACLTRFASVAEYRLAMVEKGLLNALTVLASSEDDETLRLCVHTFALLSQDKAVGAPLLHGGVIKALTLLAAAPEEAVRRACAVTLCNLSAEEARVEEMAKLGALRALLVLACVKSTDPETRRICLKAVLNLLRTARAKTMQRLCDDGLIWAISVFTDGMEARDHAILSDAFCVLALDTPSRNGLITKSPTIATLLQILGSEVACSTKLTILKGLVNLLADPLSAVLLLRIGVMPYLVAILEKEKQAEVPGIIAELFVLIFQNCPVDNDLATVTFAEPPIMRAIAHLMCIAEQEEQEGKQHVGEGISCTQSCAVLLHLLSLHECTRPALLMAHAPLGTVLPALLLQVKGDIQRLLLRCLYNLTCDQELLMYVPMRFSIPALQVALAAQELDKPVAASGGSRQEEEPEIAALCAGILRNTSTSTDCHDELSSESGTKLLCDLFAVGGKRCRENAAIAVCNLFLGRVNSHLLLSRGVLPLVLSLCVPGPMCSSEAHGMSSAVLRKLAIAPGNTQLLVRGGAVGHLVLLMNADSSMFVKTNCVAAFCLLAQKPSVLTVLAGQGVIASVLEFLETLEHRRHQQELLNATLDSRMESMCVDLLSKLAQFANANDPREQHLTSLLYRIVEKEELAGAAVQLPATVTPSALECWQNDRSFLHREHGGALPPTAISSVLMMTRSMAPATSHVLRTISYPGYAIEVNHNASYIEMGTIEPLLPPVEALNDAADAVREEDMVNFTPPPMFPKLTTPFTPLPLLTSTTAPSSSALGQAKSPMAIKSLPPRVVPPLPPRNSFGESGSRSASPNNPK